MEHTTIEHLPDEVLNLIFNRLNFHGHLRLSCVCRRFLQLIENDVTFMRTVNFRAFQHAMRKLSPTTKLIRTYSVVTLSSYDNFEDLSDLELELLESVECLNLSSCSFRDTSELASFLSHCKRLKTVLIDSRRIKSSADEPIDMFQSPVSVVIDTPVCQSLNCFANIQHIRVRDWDNWSMPGITRFLGQYAAVVTSMDIYERESDEFFKLLANKAELRLQELNLFFDEPKHVELKAQIFAHQRSCLTSLSARGFMDQLLFDAIRLNLVNLETLDLQITHRNNVRLNDLKVLPRMKNLAVSFHGFENEYNLDIGELRRLEHLKLTIGPRSRQLKLALKQPMLTLKKLELNFPAENQFLEQIATFFSNLTSLELIFHHITDKDFFTKLVPNINKLTNLQLFASISQTTPQLINDDFLAALRLPNLRRFHLYKVRTSIKFSRSALNALANNCPKLLRITGNVNINQWQESDKCSIFFRRINGTSKFRRLHRPTGMEKYKKLDYDSMESSSDEDDTKSVEASLQTMFV